jgi:hypothetical protein
VVTKKQRREKYSKAHLEKADLLSRRKNPVRKKKRKVKQICQYANVPIHRFDRCSEFAHWHIGTLAHLIKVPVSQ